MENDQGIKKDQKTMTFAKEKTHLGFSILTNEASSIFKRSLSERLTHIGDNDLFCLFVENKELKFEEHIKDNS